MTANNTNVDLVLSINSYIKFGQNLSICSQDIELKQKNWRKSRAITGTNVGKMMCNNPNIDLVNINANEKFGEIL